jgi:hypothetical protein
MNNIYFLNFLKKRGRPDRIGNGPWFEGVNIL